MFNIAFCTLSLALANFGVEYFNDAQYLDALKATWNQFIAILIFYFFWVLPEKED